MEESNKEPKWPLPLPMERISDNIVFGNPSILRQPVTLVPEILDREVAKKAPAYNNISIEDHVYRIARVAQRSPGLSEVILSAAEWLIAAGGPALQKEVSANIETYRNIILEKANNNAHTKN